MEDDLKVLGKRKSKPKVKEDFVSFDQINIAAVKSKESKKTKLKTSLQNNFRCELCSATRFVQGTFEKKKTRRIFDNQNNKVLKVCNACGLKFKRKARSKGKFKSDNYKKIVARAEDKVSYIKEGKLFALEIARLVNDRDAENFYCPKFRSKPCKCLQKFIQLGKYHCNDFKLSIAIPYLCISISYKFSNCR